MAAMRLANLLGPDLEDALKTDPDALHDALEEFHPEDIAEIVEDLSLELTLELRPRCLVHLGLQARLGHLFVQAVGLGTQAVSELRLLHFELGHTARRCELVLDDLDTGIAGQHEAGDGEQGRQGAKQGAALLYRIDRSRQFARISRAAEHVLVQPSRRKSSGST